MDPPNKPATAPPVSSKHDSHYRLKVARRRQAKMAKQLKKLSEDEFFNGDHHGSPGGLAANPITQTLIRNVRSDNRTASGLP